MIYRLPLEHIKPGAYKIQLELDNGKRSGVETVQVGHGGAVVVNLTVYSADTEVITTADKTRRGMLRRKMDNGDVILAIRPDKNVTVKAAEIKEIKDLKGDQPGGGDDGGADGGAGGGAGGAGGGAGGGADKEGH